MAKVNGPWLTGTDLPMVIGSFGASAVLLYGAPTSPLAQPYNLLVGHGLSALVGVTAFKIVGQVDWLSITLAVSVAIAVMQATRSVHPPGGATALIAVIGSPAIHGMGYGYLAFPVLTGATTMLFVALVMNNLPKGSRWPLFWSPYGLRARWRARWRPRQDSNLQPAD